MNNEGTSLYSILLELRVREEVRLPLTTGPQIHAMFLRLLTQGDSALFAQLHDVPGIRPFTLSQLLGAEIQQKCLRLWPGQAYIVRLTLLDDGELWERLSTHLLEAGQVQVQLGQTPLTITRLVVNPASDHTGWVAKTSWRALSATAPCRILSLSFASPTAFNIEGKYYALFPEPVLVWKSLLRTWNTYAPERLRMEKQELSPSIQEQVSVVACDHLATHILQYQTYMQKGFTGICSYELHGDSDVIQKLTTLAEFARYAGVGYRTTWGMGQTRLVQQESSPAMPREVRLC